MRLFSPLTLLLFIVVWSAVFILIARYFLFSAHQSWFKDEEQNLLASVELKIDNLDARNMRQLNQLYAEIKTLQEMLSKKSEKAVRNISVQTPSVAVSPAHGIEQTIAVLVIACNRVDYVKQTLDELLKHRPSAGLFPIIVSQDCGHQATASAIASYGARITHIKHPVLSDVVIPAKERHLKNKISEIGYYKISRHFKWALGQVFDELGYDHVVVVEDDVIIAPDFYMYFSALWRLLNSDPSIMCISAYADNAKDNGRVRYFNPQQNDLLYRTDFFPGLGWMLNKKLWLELKPKWPLAFWDDWLRLPEVRKDRVCIRPEVSRTKTIGKKGVSVGVDFNKHLQFIALNKDPVDFTKMNLTYLKKEVYDKNLALKVDQLPTATLNDVLWGTVKHDEVKIYYSNNKEFESMAKKFEIMSDLRSGVPRTAYKGIVTFMHKNSKRIYLVPTHPWKGYTA